MDSEINAIKKAAPLSVALVFPDVYDVGMSHIGLRILYDIINRLPYARAERAFHPWPDMEEAMRATGEPMRSLESGVPLGEFDVVGFSLQYELCYTSVLNVLDLAGLPLRAAERDDKAPLVIAGGPCTVNPMPFAAFMDAILVGDGEDAVPEMLDVIHCHRTEGDGSKRSVLGALAAVPGVYVPSVHGGTPASVKRRYIASLEDAPWPAAPVVPFTEIVHDRVAVEVSRGCTQGCRFCQAGIIYRPLRARSPRKVLEIATEQIRNTGYDDVSFTSLSAGDYAGMLDIINAFNCRFAHRRISVSLPSLRVAAVNADILREISSVKKTGFTIAPEAATERLRAVINKNFTDEDFDRAVTTLFKEGWLTLKLYYMIGLPTEGPEDISAIAAMAGRARGIAKRHAKRGVNISVTISPFVPKAHTPFQYAPFAGMDYISACMNELREGMKRMTFKGHDPDTSLLEACFARGDGRLADLLVEAHRRGARLDAWSEHFSLNAWRDAMDATGIGAEEYARRAYEPGGALPWDVVDTGVTSAFLAREYESAMNGKTTRDCSASCTACGLKCREDGSAAAPLEASAIRQPRPAPDAPPLKPIKLRVRYSRTGLMRYLSHREHITHITRALNRAEVPLEYSQGFSPAPKLSFGPPLNVGVAGESEFFDMEIIPRLRLAELADKLNAALAGGFRVLGITPLPHGARSLQAFVTRYVYEARGDMDAAALDMFLKSKERIIERKGKRVDIRPLVEHASVDPATGAVRLVLCDTEALGVRVDEVAREALGAAAADLDITRKAVFGRMRSRWVEPDALHEAEAAAQGAWQEDT